jgi:hypothetical protein
MRDSWSLDVKKNPPFLGVPEISDHVIDERFRLLQPTFLESQFIQ